MKLSPIENAVYGMQDQNQSAAVVLMHQHKTGVAYEKARFDASILRKKYGEELRRAVSRRAHCIAREHSEAWSVAVNVFPLLSGITGTVMPIVEIRWTDSGAETKISCAASSPEKVSDLLMRFRGIVVANQFGK